MPGEERGETDRRRPVVILLVINLFLLLFPPVTWILPAGNAAAGIGYFAVTGVIAVASLFAMTRPGAGSPS